MRGDRLAQGQEPDRGFVLLARLAVERLEDFLGRFRRAEQFFQVRDDRLVERDIELGSAEEFVEMRSDGLIGTQEIQLLRLSAAARYFRNWRCHFSDRNYESPARIQAFDEPGVGFLATRIPKTGVRGSQNDRTATLRAT